MRSISFSLLFLCAICKPCARSAHREKREKEGKSYSLFYEDRTNAQHFSFSPFSLRDDKLCESLGSPIVTPSKPSGTGIRIYPLFNFSNNKKHQRIGSSIEFLSRNSVDVLRFSILPLLNRIERRSNPP